MRETNNLNVLRFCALSCFVARCSLFVVQMQLQARAISSVSVPRAFHMFNNGVVMCSPISCKSSLAELVASNQHKGTACDETLVMFYAIEILRTLEALHTCGLVAGNIQRKDRLSGCIFLLFLGGGKGGLMFLLTSFIHQGYALLLRFTW